MPIHTDIDLLQSVPYKRSQNILKHKKLKLTTQMSGIFSSFNPIHGGKGSGGRGQWAKRSLYQFFSCNLYKHRNQPHKISDLVTLV